MDHIQAELVNNLILKVGLKCIYHTISSQKFHTFAADAKAGFCVVNEFT